MTKQDTTSGNPEISLFRLVLFAALLIPFAIRHLFVWGGDWGEMLNLLEMVGVLGLFAGMSITLGKFLHRRCRVEKNATRLVFLLGLIFVFMPPFLSNDVRDYLARGRIQAVHGANPYLETTGSYPQDEYVAAGLPEWRDLPCPYGPLATETQGLVARAATSLRKVVGIWPSICTGIFLFKLLAWFCLLGTAAAVRRSWKDLDETQGTKAWVAIAASPFLLFELAGMAHNDALMILPATWAVLLATRHKYVSAGFVLVIAALAKPPALVLWPLFAGQALRNKRFSALLCGSLACAIPALVYFWWRFFTDPAALAVFFHQAEITRASIRLFLGDGLVNLGLAAEHATLWAKLITGGGFFTLYTIWVIQSRLDTVPLPDLCARTFIATAFLALGLTNPWYFAWAFPFAWFPGGERWRHWAGALNFFGPCSYAVAMATRTLGLLHQSCQLSLLALPMLKLKKSTHPPPLK